MDTFYCTAKLPIFDQWTEAALSYTYGQIVGDVHILR